MNVTGHFWKLVCLIAIISGNVSCGAREYPLHEPKWLAEPVRVNLAKYGDYYPRLEFSTDGTMVCAFWEDTYRHDDKMTGPPLRVVFDTTGKIIANAVDAKGMLSESFSSRFPGSVPRTSGMVNAPLDERLKQATPFPDFLQDAGSWGFNRDFTLGIRLVDPRSPLPPHNRKEKLTVGVAYWTVELWRITPKRDRLWAVHLPKFTGDLHDVLFFQRDENKLIALALHPDDGYILSQNDGKVVGRLLYNSAEDRQQQDKQMPEFPKTNGSESDSHKFSASKFSFDPTHNLLACGEFTGRCIRVFALDGEGKLIFEANALDNPYEPMGGVWSVWRVEFASKGEYLIVDYYFGGRTNYSFRVTDIFETKTWRKVWSKNSQDIASVCLSPDGMKMAFIRVGKSGKFLEIGPFSAEKGGAGGTVSGE